MFGTIGVGTIANDGTGDNFRAAMQKANANFAAILALMGATYTSGGSANAQTLTPSPAVAALVDGMRVTFVAGYTNTATATFNVSGLGAYTIYRNDGSTALTGGEIQSGRRYELIYKASTTRWILAKEIEIYETGSWTPTLIGATTPGTQTYTAQIGRYTRIGNFVQVWGRVTISAKDGAIAGDSQIGGLPFAASNISGLGGFPIDISYTSGVNLDAGYTQFGGLLAPNTSLISLYQMGDNVTSGAIAVGNLASATDIIFGAQYRVG